MNKAHVNIQKIKLTHIQSIFLIGVEERGWRLYVDGF